MLGRPQSKRSLGDKIYAVYFVFIAGVLWGLPFYDVFRTAVGSIPAEHAPSFGVVVVGLLVALAVSSGLAGGPFWLESPVAWYVVPTHLGQRVVDHAYGRLLLGWGFAGTLGGTLIVSALAENAPAEATVGGMLSGLAVGVLVPSVAVAVHTRRRARSVRTLGLVTVVYGALVGLTLASDGGGLTLARCVTGESPIWPVVAIELAVAAVAVVSALGSEPWLDHGRVVDRSNGVQLYLMAVSNQDLRSILVIQRSLSGEIPRERTPSPQLLTLLRWRPTTARHLLSIRRSPWRRLWRLTLLLSINTWAWWLVWLHVVVAIPVVVVTTWLVVVDVAEPFAQEIDRPALHVGSAMRHRLRHLAVVAVLSFPMLMVPAVALLALAPAADVASAVVAMGVPLTAMAAFGMLHTLIRPDAPPPSPFAVVQPESLAVSILFRESLPIAITAVGLQPLFGHERWLGDPAAALAAAGNALPLLLICIFGVLATAMARSQPKKTPRRGKPDDQ